MTTRRSRLRDAAGITLLEVTLMMVVSTAIIAGVAPTLSVTIRDAKLAGATLYESQIVTASNSAVGVAPADTGCRKFTTNGKCNGTQVSLLVTDGDMPDACVAVSGCGGGATSWDRLVNGGIVDYLERHLVTNNMAGGSYSNLWRGAYLNAPIDPDPWGNRYMINAHYMNDNPESVWVLSAGPDEMISTVFLGTWPVAAGGDDIITRVEQ